MYRVVAVADESAISNDVYVWENDDARIAGNGGNVACQYTLTCAVQYTIHIPLESERVENCY